MNKYQKYLLKKGDNTSGMMSISQVLTYLKCRKSWQFSYEQNLTPRIERPYLTIGKLCHQGMQGAWNAHARGCNTTQCIESGINRIIAYFEKYRETVPLLEEELSALWTLVEDSQTIFRNAYMDFAPEKYDVVMIGNTPAIELHFKVPLVGTRGMHGFIDLIVQDKTNGQIWLVDYKFRSALASDDDERFNLQNVMYMKAAECLGINCTGTMTYQYLNTAPSLPSVNKNGTVSRAKIKTTWAQYAAFCESVGQNPNDYAEEMIPKLAEIEWFRATKELRSEDMISRVWNQIIIPTVREIKSTKKKCIPSMYSMNCHGCSFVELCQGNLRNYDYQFIQDAEFIDKDKVRFDIDDFEYNENSQQNT